MDDMSNSALQSQSPIRTEWNSRCVIITYFQGDISREVDEHFSRALGLSISSLQELSPSSRHRREDVILTNETDLASNQWRFSSPWTKPQPEANLGNDDVNYSMDEFDPVAVNPYPITTTRSPLPQPDQPWQLPTLPYSSSLDLTYPSAFSVPEALVPAPEPQQEEKYESLLNFLQQDRCLALPQQQVSWEDGYSAQRAGSSGLLFNLPPGSSSAQCGIDIHSACISADTDSQSMDLARNSHSTITPGGAWGTLWNAGDQTLVSCMQDIDICGYMRKNCAVSTVGWNTDGSNHHHPNITTLYNLNPTQPLFDKKIYFSPVCGPVSTGYADEKSQMPESSKDFYY